MTYENKHTDSQRQAPFRDTLELALVLGVKFKREASSQFAHSNLITVLNGQGEIVHQLVGLNQEIEETVERVKKSAGQ